MKKVIALSLFAIIVWGTAILAHAQCPSSCLFYGGDFDPNNPNANGLANENDAIVGGNPYGAATYQNFLVGVQGVNVSGLFTNNLSYLTPSSGYWEIRSGVSEGNLGILIASGTGSGGNFSHTATGRGGFGYPEYTDLVTGLNVNLPSGIFWFAMVPECPTCEARSFNSNSLEKLNAVGTQVSDLQYFNSSFFDGPTNADNEGVFPTFSSGVLGTEAPEPSSLILVGSGVAAAVGAVRRRVGTVGSPRIETVRAEGRIL